MLSAFRAWGEVFSANISSLNTVEDSLKHKKTPTVVCVPGLNTPNGSLKGIIDGLSTKFNILVSPSYLDLKAGATSIQAKIEDLLGERWKDGLIFVGHSAGGIVSMKVAPKYNGAVLGIHTIATPYAPFEDYYSSYILPSVLTNRFQLDRVISGVSHVPITTHITQHDSIVHPSLQDPRDYPNAQPFHYADTHFGILSGENAIRIAQVI